MTNTNDTGTAGKKKQRGRPKGSQLPPRNIFVVCNGVYEGPDGPALASENIQVLGDKTSSNSELIEKAKKIFKEKYSIEPENVHGPFHMRMGQSGYVKKRDSVRLSAKEIEDLHFSGKSARAVFTGWNVTVQYYEERNDIAFVMFKNVVNPSEDGKKHSKPAPKAVPVKLLQNVEPF
jgi:hypothetical protein